MGMLILAATLIPGEAPSSTASVTPAAADAACVAGTESDFNGDGVRDTAVADPLATVSGLTRAGLVRVVLGGSGQSFEISQGLPEMGVSPEANDQFGKSLASYDENGDGCSDLVVGVPMEDVSVSGVDMPDAGMIHVIHGTPTGIGPGSTVVTWRQSDLAPATSVEANDWFGWSLAAGKTSAGQQFLAVGVPGENVGSAVDAGLIHYVQGATRTTASQDDPGVPGTAELNDRFGYSLAASPRYLAVGAPGEAIGEEAFAGLAIVFSHTITSGVPTAIAGVDQSVDGVSGTAETGDQLGTSLSMVAYRPSGAASETDALLAVGVPGEDIDPDPADPDDAADAGMVHVLQVPASGAVTQLKSVDRSVADVEGDVAAGDYFGQRVALANTAPGTVGTAATVRLAVGVPGHDTESGAEAGAVQVFPALGDPGAGDRILVRGGGVIPGDPGRRDYTGISLMATSANLYVGVPFGKTAGESRGGVYVLPWTLVDGGAGTATTLRPGAGGIPDDGDTFGTVIR
ncbi:hypothetical protein SRB5_57010 [Streptomyces sp. RB5]|uniref:VCBS repeat-containing protein n=1 Tax=Streptomyces smaragdinus TaxID=2585196 RepID=A0A7K0CQ00_9ACTN|nr:hypothetical protein [Streptomyces smaragdinus]MQY15519.1 hypothetical protein [Streptomyces smaragdinus]